MFISCCQWSMGPEIPLTLSNTHTHTSTRTTEDCCYLRFLALPLLSIPPAVPPFLPSSGGYVEARDRASLPFPFSLCPTPPKPISQLFLLITGWLIDLYTSPPFPQFRTFPLKYKSCFEMQCILMLKNNKTLDAFYENLWACNFEIGWKHDNSCWLSQVFRI